MRKIISASILVTLLAFTNNTPAQSGGWDKIKAFKAKQILYVHNFIVVQTLYRFTNSGSEAFRPSGEFGFEFYQPPGTSFVGLTFQGQSIGQLPTGHAKNYLSLPSGIPPGQSFMQFNIAIRKAEGEKVSFKDKAVYSVFKDANLYWEDKALKVNSNVFKATDIGDGMFMGKPGFRKVKVKYGKVGKAIQLSFAGGKSVSMEGANQSQNQGQGQRRSKGGPIEIVNKFWISSNAMAIALLLVILIGGGMASWARVAKIKPVFGPTIKHFERKRDKLLARENRSSDETKKLELLDAYIKHLKEKV